MQQRSSLVQMLYCIALEGNVTSFEHALVQHRSITPQDISIVFTRDIYDLGRWRYVLYELVRDGKAAMFQHLVETHGLSIYVLEEDYLKRRRQLKPAQWERIRKRDPLDVGMGDGYYLRTRRLYGRAMSLQEFTERERTMVVRGFIESRQKCTLLYHELVAAQAELRTVAVGRAADRAALAAYQEVQCRWRADHDRLKQKRVAESELRKHQRLRPQIVPQFELEYAVRQLNEQYTEQKRECIEMLATLRGISMIARLLKTYKKRT